MNPKTWFVVRYHYAKVTLEPEDPAVVVRVEVLSLPTQDPAEAHTFYSKLADKSNAHVVEAVFG